MGPASRRPGSSAADHVDETAGDGRAVVLPGQLYAYYDWGGTIDPILPVLDRQARRDPQRRRLRRPARHRPAVDRRRARPAAPRAARPARPAAGPARRAHGARRRRRRPHPQRRGARRRGGRRARPARPPDAAWGAPSRRPRAAGNARRPRRLPQVRAWDRPGRARARARRARPSRDVVVDGSAEGLAALRAGRALRRRRLRRRPDGRRRSAARSEVVITDSNRRRVLVPSRLAQNAGPVLAADEEPSVDAARAGPVRRSGRDAQTVAVYDGHRGASARRPRPASRSSPSTGRSRRSTATRRRTGRPTARSRPTATCSTVAFDAPPRRRLRRPAAVRRPRRRRSPRSRSHGTPLSGPRGLEPAAARAARRRPRCSVRIVVDQKPGPTVTAGIRELRIPGVHATEALRPPVLAERALAGADLARSLTYLFQRTTGDDPFRRDPRHGSAERGARARPRRRRARPRAGLLAARPRARGTIDGWATRRARRPRLRARRARRRRGRVRRPRRASRGARASAPRAPSTARRSPGSARGRHGRRAWIEWERRGGRRSRRSRSTPSPGVRRPDAGARDRRLRRRRRSTVGADGVVRLPAPLRGRRFRLEILRAAFPPGTPGSGAAAARGRDRRDPRRGRAAVEVPRAAADRLRLRRVRRDRRRRASALRASRRRSRTSTPGRPLRVARLRAASTLPAGETRLSSASPGVFTPYLLRLRSPAPARAPGAARAASSTPGTATRGGREGVRLALDAPRPAGPRRELQPRPPRELRRPGPRRRPRSATPSAPPGACPRPAATWRSRSPRTALVNAGYAVSLLVGVLLLVLLVLPAAPPARVREPTRPASQRAGTPRCRARRAALIAVPVGARVRVRVRRPRRRRCSRSACSSCSGAASARKQLALAGGAVLGDRRADPHVLIRPENRGGYNPEYSIDRDRRPLGRGGRRRAARSLRAQ